MVADHTYLLGWDADGSVKRQASALFGPKSTFVLGRALIASARAQTSGESVTIVEGAAIDPRCGRRVDNDWGSDWELDGQFVAARIRHDFMELVTDPLGVEQVFYVHQNGMCLISNRALLLATLVGVESIDPLGAALALGWG